MWNSSLRIEMKVVISVCLHSMHMTSYPLRNNMVPAIRLMYNVRTINNMYNNLKIKRNIKRSKTNTISLLLKVSIRFLCWKSY